MEVNTTSQFDLFGFLGLLTLAFLGGSLLLVVLIYYGKYYFAWLRNRNRVKESLDYVLLKVSVTKDNEVKIDATEQLISALNAIKKNTGFLKLKPQNRISLEIVSLHESIRFFISCHKSLQDLIEKQIHGAYPDAAIKRVPEYNIFTETGQTAYDQLVCKSADFYPLKTYRDLPTDPLSALTSALAKMQPDEGAIVQLILSPADGKWKDSGKAWLKKEKDPGKPDNPKPAPDPKQLEAVEGKLAKPGFNTIIRIITSSSSKTSAKAHLDNIKAAFEQFAGPFNNLSSAKIKDTMGSSIRRVIIGWPLAVFCGLLNGEIVPFGKSPKEKLWYLNSAEDNFMIDLIYRFLPVVGKTATLTPDEIASIFHFPSKSIQTPYIDWLPARAAPASEKVPTSGLYLGKSVFRGTERPIYISEEDRQRHMYIIGRTGTGKTTLLKTLILQDILAGKGLAFIDPHGDAAEEILSLIPPERAKDVIYFDPGDTQRPFGMNMLDARNEDEKHFITTEILGLMYKLYDPNKTGIIGPRFEHGVRNAMLTAMAVPGNTFVEVMRIMQDPEFVKELLPFVNDPIVRRYWTDQIAHTQDFHKSEVLDYTVSKFGRFVTNKMLRNIIGQSQSSFNLRDIMDHGKILIVNLAKGRMGEENSNFLGLILVPKILAAAMSRSNIPEDQRRPFYLYVDEFQNFATDTFATILSEARKYRLNLIVANQFIGQIPEDIKNAIFGNVGTLIAYRVGVTDANFLQHEFSPSFNESDLVNIEAWNVYVKTQVHGEPIPPFSMKVDIDFNTWNSMKRPEVASAIKELSRLTYGRDMMEVETEITRRAKL